MNLRDFFQYLSGEFDQCLPEVFPNVLCQICLRESDVFLDQLTTFLACLFLPTSVMRNLLMFIWIDLACLLASIFLVNSIGVCLSLSANVCYEEPADICLD